MYTFLGQKPSLRVKVGYNWPGELCGLVDVIYLLIIYEYFKFVELLTMIPFNVWRENWKTQTRNLKPVPLEYYSFSTTTSLLLHITSPNDPQACWTRPWSLRQVVIRAVPSGLAPSISTDVKRLFQCVSEWCNFHLNEYSIEAVYTYKADIRITVRNS